MMTRANCHSLVIQQDSQVLRMNTFNNKRGNTYFLFSCSNQFYTINGFQLSCCILQQSIFMFSGCFFSNTAYKIQSCFEGYCICNIRGACFKLIWQLVPACFFKTYFFDHFTSTHERRLPAILSYRTTHRYLLDHILYEN